MGMYTKLWVVNFWFMTTDPEIKKKLVRKKKDSSRETCKYSKTNCEFLPLLGKNNFISVCFIVTFQSQPVIRWIVIPGKQILGGNLSKKFRKNVNFIFIIWSYQQGAILSFSIFVLWNSIFLYGNAQQRLLLCNSLLKGS